MCQAWRGNLRAIRVAEPKRTEPKAERRAKLSTTPPMRFEDKSRVNENTSAGSVTVASPGGWEEGAGTRRAREKEDD